jgi:TetR/AcrR family transcriptional regulator, repressor for uid operon
VSAAPSSSPFERPSAREIQRQRTRARLFDAALAEFARAGFDRASVAEIARAADVSRPSFYFHFPTKEHVLLELQWRSELELVERLSGCDTLQELLGALPDAIADVYAGIEGPGVARDMVLIYARLPEYLPLAEQPFPLVRLLERRFSEGAERGELRAGLHPGQATFLCLTSVFGYLIGAAPDADHRANLRALVALFLA